MDASAEPIRRHRLLDDARRTAGQVRDLLETSGSMLGSLLVTSGLGFVYWWVAARAFPEVAVGIAAAAVSAMWLFGTLGMFGLGTLLTRELPQHPGRELSLILAAVALTTAGGLVLGVAFAVVAPILDPELAELGSHVVPVVVFAIGVGLTASSEVLDLALIGAARLRLQFFRNVVFAIVKLVAVAAAAVWLAGTAGLPIYAAWVVGLLASVVVVVGYLVLDAEPGADRRPDWRAMLRFGPAALGHHLLNLTLASPGWILPILVTVLISAEANATFFVAGLLAGLAFYIPDALTYSLFAVGARRPAELWRSVRLTMAASLAAAAGATVLMALIGPWLLGLYGESYREQGSALLVVLTAAVVPITVRAHYVAVKRIQGEISRATAVAVAASVFEMVMAALGAVLGGLMGVALGFALAVSIEAVLLAPPVIRAARRPA
jgi:O-antigen/teichoic acid export membrane protein